MLYITACRGHCCQYFMRFSVWPCIVNNTLDTVHTVCSPTYAGCRKWKCRGSHHQTEDYGAVDNLEIDTFHSIPYRRDGLPECPISLHTGETNLAWSTLV